MTYEKWLDEQDDETRELLNAHLHGLTSALKKERTAGKEAKETVARLLAEAVTKTEDGKAFPAGDYAYVPDSAKPSTWKLRLTKAPGGPPDSGIVGAAAAALGPGFRGQKVQIPAGDLAAVKAKVRAAWKKANPDKEADEMPAGIKEAAVGGQELSHDDVRQLLRKAVDGARSPAPESGKSYTWVRDVYDAKFIYSDDETGKMYQRSYVIDAEGAVTVGEPVEVVRQTTYVPAAEAAIIEGDFVPLVETSVSDDGTVALKLIQPGWGTSGYYSPGLLERDGPAVFKQGTKMFWDHPTATEDAERPERSLRDLAAELVSDAEWKENGPAGPALYGDAKVFEPFPKAVDELAPHIGVSILAFGKAKEGEAEGREGPIIKEIVSVRSVDFVTEPGAGGQVLQLFESARRPVVPQKQEVKKVDEKEAKALRDANVKLQEDLDAAKAETQRLGEATLLREARDFVASTLKDVEMPDMTRERLVSLLAPKPVLKDGALDEAGYKVVIETAVKEELAYLSKAAGSGVIKGMGSEAPTETADVKEGYVAYYKRQGIGAEQAEKMAALAAEGGK